MTRFLDIMLALIALLIFSPVFILLAIRIKLDTRGDIFYKQKRVGMYGKEFYLYKFRSMRIDADKESLLTFGDADERITPSGAFMRKYKLDELPQLFNVLIGQMSMVGPRPEVKKYTELYTNEQKAVLNVRPGITDMASVTYYNENSLLEKQDNPEQYYIKYIMPDKIRLNMMYINNPSVYNYFKIIMLTLKAAFK
jgi:lipopolysaccharide/colanic/teichoic acid biosynthesis glycosyltransferase